MGIIKFDTHAFECANMIQSNVNYFLQVPWAAIARVLLKINSCVNPFIYAWTIPEFRKIVRNILLCNFYE